MTTLTLTTADAAMLLLILRQHEQSVPHATPETRAVRERAMEKIREREQDNWSQWFREVSKA